MAKAISDQNMGNCVFWLDNASIHNKIKSFVKETNHQVLFNAAWSPELNPIEQLFHVWKSRAAKGMGKEHKTDKEVITELNQILLGIPSGMIQSTFEHVRDKIWVKVSRKEDL